MTGVLSLIMDVVIILLLGGTIFYAMRLSAHIKVFRDSRKDLEKLLQDLSGQIQKAEDAIEGLRANAKACGRDLQAQISEAKALSDELQIISESGNSLASRLEKAAEQGSRSSQAARRNPADFDMPPRRAPKRPAPPPRPAARPASETNNDPLAAFAIRDPEFDDDLDADMDEQGLMQGDFEEEDEFGSGNFSSQAERDLFEALRRKKKTEAGGVS